MKHFFHICCYLLYSTERVPISQSTYIHTCTLAHTNMHIYAVRIVFTDTLACGRKMLQLTAKQCSLIICLVALGFMYLPTQEQTGMIFSMVLNDWSSSWSCKQSLFMEECWEFQASYTYHFMSYLFYARSALLLTSHSLYSWILWRICF